MKKLKWFEVFEEQLYKASKCDMEMVIFGDFNINMFKESNYGKWKTMYVSFNLKQIITEATRVTVSSSTLIDHVYVTQGIIIVETCVSQLALSDHFPVAFTMSDKKEKVQHPHHTICYRKITKTGLNDFSDSVKSA